MGYFEDLRESWRQDQEEIDRLMRIYDEYIASFPNREGTRFAQFSGRRGAILWQTYEMELINPETKLCMPRMLDMGFASTKLGARFAVWLSWRRHPRKD